MAEETMMTEDNKHLIFTLGKETYGVPILKIQNIERKLDITPVPGAPSFVKGITNLRGQIIPVLDLKEKLGIGATEVTDKTCIIIVNVRKESGMHKNGVMVDEVSEVMDMSDGYIEPVPKYHNTQINQEVMSGIGKVRDQVIILLDIQKILEMSDNLSTVI
ncbi:MAG: chemotaxis protein CheW [Oscillospiraceae bacterium]|nr:chemotaxis protein CheW [Oscillospiraceae bacterium]